jgi:alpha-tubulin suppressor-like RCC1 family protein
VASTAGPEVSAALGADGRAWLWGFGTNNQLGNGNDDSDKEVPSLLKAKALQGQRIVQVRPHMIRETFCLLFCIL